MLKKYPFIFILFLILMGCSTHKVQLVDPSLRAIPDPHFVLEGVGQPITVLFYYSAFEGVEDIDGTIVANPRYLDFLRHHDIFTNKIKAITVTIEVSNPEGLDYSLVETVSLKVKKLGDVQSGRTLNSSNLIHRQFVYELPLGSNVRDVDHCIKVFTGGNEIMRIGHFRYHVIHSKGGEKSFQTF